MVQPLWRTVFKTKIKKRADSLLALSLAQVYSVGKAMGGLVRRSCKPERGSSPETDLRQNLDLPASRTVVRRDNILRFQPLVQGHLS